MNSLSTRNSGIDAKILEAQFENARISTAERPRKVDLSSPSTAERIKRIVEAGVITGYRVEVDPKCLGPTLPVCLRIRPVPGEMESVASMLNDIPEIVDCDRVTGDD